MIFTKIRNRNKAREEFEKFISKSVEILAEDEMKMNIHKDKMLWYNTCKKEALIQALLLTILGLQSKVMGHKVGHFSKTYMNLYRVLSKSEIR